MEWGLDEPNMKIPHGLAKIFFLVSLAIAGSCLEPSAAGDNRTTPKVQQSDDPRDDSSPWGVASGAEWFSAYPKFNPMLRAAGVQWLRGFYEWQTLQPKQGYWNWTLADRLVENARVNGVHLTLAFAYFAPWASADGGTRKFPIKDMQFWRDYVSGLVGRYHNDIKYWEVWNEFNGSFAENGSPQIYADMVREASISAKKVDPTAKIGLSVANFDIGFLDAAIKAGAAGHFDYICVHPYEKLDALLDDGEVGFLNMTATLRKMLAANGQPVELPLWITEVGAQTSVAPNQQADERQAMLLAKVYLLSIASGFQRVFWFEARGPSYGHNTDHGLIRADFTIRPSYQAMKLLTGILGPEPMSSGWLDLGNGGYGFLFQQKSGRSILAGWGPTKKNIKVVFDGDVQVADLEGNRKSLPAGQQLSLTDAPILIENVPAAMVAAAQANNPKPYPWTGIDARSQIVKIRLQDQNVEGGIRQVNPSTTPVVVAENNSWRRTDFSRTDNEGRYAYFAIDPQFAPFGSRNFEITAVVRRTVPDKTAGVSLNYESVKGYVNSDYFNISEGDQWQELTWRIADANFVGQWGWNFRLSAISSPNEFLIREVRVKKIGLP
jgi:polysaccharide biosynthesis protein PslG